MTLSLRLLALYPKKIGSAAVGRLATLRLPVSWREPLLGAFARRFGIRLDEAALPLREHACLQDLFTRRLAPGLRPQDPPVPGGVNSPVDARVIATGRVEAGTAIQAKGLPYRIHELLKHHADAGRFEGAAYVTLYLAPSDYHRIHVPATGRVTAVSRVEGELWPVNDASTAATPRLYERNRRATWLATGTGTSEGLEIAVVLVGATHVGGVLLDDRWLAGRALPRDGAIAVSDLPCEPGDDLGTFAFGSTVVLLIGGPRSAAFVTGVSTGETVRVGRRLGRFDHQPSAIAPR